ncbi:ADP/ATP carrier protein [Coemansia biformis]|uniref:ADP/ATP translocase n=1 Tax=Coemansia biformis TaxID=1286918 RepID=A0A9W7YC85_9FUNG|nr:ADP/ATP carrier protein [Coemansia biformis]
MAGTSQSSDRAQVFFTGLAAGTFSKGVAATINAPLERVRLLLQVQGFPGHIPQDQRYTGAINALRRLPAEQGLVSLWRGNLANIIRFVPTYCLNAAMASKYKSLFPKYNARTDFWKFFMTSMASAGLAGATSLLFVYPLDLARTRMALDVGVGPSRQFSGLWNCLSTVYQRGGIGALYSGYGTSVAAIVLHRALFFGIYDTAKQITTRDGRRPSYFAAWLMAQGITTAVALATYPLDTIRRHLMMQAGASTPTYAGAVDCARTLYTTGGIRAFYGGVHLQLLAPIVATLLSVLYDYYKQSRKQAPRKANA